MIPEDYAWSVKLVQDQHGYLGLSFEQAEKIYRFEQEKDTWSDKHFFSAWEEWDYELTTFREVLNETQLEAYMAALSERIRNHVHQLKSGDPEREREVRYHEELTAFYETQLLPELYSDVILRFGWLMGEQAKIEYLRAEYKRFLNDGRKSILISHFRHNRSFMPVTLTSDLLRHRLTALLPDYHSFRQVMDEPTRSVATCIEKKVRHLPPGTNDLVARKFTELAKFREDLFDRYHSDRGGWHTVISQTTAEEETVITHMSLLLLDAERYGY
ncbi:hypothetical protein [Flaviaesturariibacter amylovorans]|uniref:Uncharacterized protein n=1 Tax=Flaviaesturariibacter amylovorans TaxID=1084520 RepID=A0ABP8GWH8_9BACT